MPVVVIDTNLIIAGRWKRDSSSNRIIDRVIEGKLKAVYTTETKNENLYILEKVKAPKDYIDKILRFYRVSKKVYSKRKITACPDKADNRFLEVAVAGKADYIITSDRDLLDMREFEGVKILKPGAFERLYNIHFGR
ncbi:MAG: putative toxin-antitoxin system toxin component, PIN family [Candidatus Altiarchaeales archaeon ex4484_43]|nr:MAG: putative toxin-antitoxin system toxin component, PIN family [Candidatus Altiarchaeales archaeon ex4484_43]RLI89382.1 MAG: putative toxin-antitoxin system toxin component, PIN family [Candidatus Altiarchaeales archaeon]